MLFKLLYKVQIWLWITNIRFFCENQIVGSEKAQPRVLGAILFKQKFASLHNNLRKNKNLSF